MSVNLYSIVLCNWAGIVKKKIDSTEIIQPVNRLLKSLTKNEGNSEGKVEEKKDNIIYGIRD